MSESAGLSSPEPLPQSFLGRFAPASMISECYPTHLKISQQKISSQKYPNKKYLLNNYSNKVIILKHLQPERLHQELHQASLHWEPDHSRYVNQQSLITKKTIFSFHLCSTNCAPEIWEKKRDLTDEKDSNPLVVGVVQLLTIVVSFAAMTLVWGNISCPVPNDLKGHNVSDTWCYKQIMDNEILSNHILALKWP